MKRNEYYFVVFFVIVGLFFGYFVIGGISSYIVELAKNSGSPNVYDFSNNSPEIGMEKVNDRNNTIQNNGVNVTNRIVADLSSKFLANNIISSTSSSSSDLTITSLLGEIDIDNVNKDDLEKIGSEIDPNDFGIIYTYDASKLNIVFDTPASVDKYWNDYFSIMSDLKYSVDSVNINRILNLAVSNPDNEELNSMLLKIKSTEERLKKINVPQLLVDFHVKNIVFFTNFYSSLDSVINFKKDPFKAYILSQYLMRSLDDWSEIRNFINEYAYKE